MRRKSGDEMLHRMHPPMRGHLSTPAGKSFISIVAVAPQALCVLNFPFPAECGQRVN